MGANMVVLDREVPDLPKEPLHNPLTEAPSRTTAPMQGCAWSKKSQSMHHPLATAACHNATLRSDR